MLLHEIIAANETDSQSILIELLLPYKRSLNVIYSREYKGDPILMVTSVSNAAQYGKIVPANDFSEAVCEWLHDYNCNDPESETFAEYETICFNSIPLNSL